MNGSKGERDRGGVPSWRCRFPGEKGFTLVELLIVIAIIALLLSILVPSIGHARELAWSAACKANLHFLDQALRGQGRSAMNANTWTGTVGAAGAEGNMVCPKHDPTSGPPDLTNVFILQVPGWFFSNVQDLLEGKKVPDNQVILNPPGIAGDHGWNPPDPGENQALICVDDDAACMITFYPDPMIESLPVPGDGNQCGSDHWVVRGDGSGGWQQATINAIESEPRHGGRPPTVLMRLTGQNYDDKIDPPVRLSGPSTSYAMNDLVTAIDHPADRVMLVEYDKTIAWWGGSGNYMDELEDWAAPRHFDMANIVFVDGSVSEMSVDQIREEIEKAKRDRK